MTKLTFNNNLDKKKEILWGVGDWFISKGYLYLIIHNSNTDIALNRLVVDVINVSLQSSAMTFCGDVDEPLLEGISTVISNKIDMVFKDAVKVENINIDIS